MTRDSIVEEVRRAREEYAARFNYDLRAMCEDLRKRSVERGVKTVTLSPRPVPTVVPTKTPHKKVG
jgi:hypothetical protein